MSTDICSTSKTSHHKSSIHHDVRTKHTRLSCASVTFKTAMFISEDVLTAYPNIQVKDLLLVFFVYMLINSRPVINVYIICTWAYIILATIKFLPCKALISHGNYLSLCDILLWHVWYIILVRLQYYTLHNITNSYSASRDNWCTVGGDGGCRVGEVRAGTTSPMPDHKGFKLQ